MVLRIHNDIQVVSRYCFTRKLHPVGQGAFYSEVFSNEDGPVFTVVYDCGTETASRDMDKTLKNQVEEFKTAIKQIDILFISHFHHDHISGLENLLEGVRVVKTVIPMLPIKMLTLTRVKNLLDYRKDGLSVDEMIQELNRPEGESNRFGEIIAVEPLGYSDYSGDNDFLYYKHRIPNGQTIPGLEDIWEYVPFNSVGIQDQRAMDFSIGIKTINGALDDSGKLNVSKLIYGQRKRIRNLYRDVMDGKNDNLYSMTVESRPSKSVLEKSDPAIGRKARCLYTGDFDSKMNDSLWNGFRRVYDYLSIGTVQIPHHGSKNSWRNEMLEGPSRSYFISVATNNIYHHPDFWVVNDIRSKGKLDIITEKEATTREDKYALSCIKSVNGVNTQIEEILLNSRR